ncbi:uncharacterized protein EDB93DRAFT_1102394 [Suillus bovinus]|uniref:uncharacterized protein n=1 Tax=Suillus bovinus TaxID=48563 RepID=UPI001B8847E5|nr:uncharacterized protein EDB93DRAFT_1102394 [Suillus bovinus]KAG2154258.1 hypothetical protein EDB93DRAFT_1102394 [Suillus bovinus]
MSDSESDETKLPRHFYRVFDEESRSQYSHTRGFVSSIPHAVYDPDHRNARRELERHMDWSNRRQTPFISVTASRGKALEFALNLVERGSRNVSIAKICSLQLQQSGISLHLVTTMKTKECINQRRFSNVYMENKRARNGCFGKSQTQMSAHQEDDRQIEVWSVNLAVLSLTFAEWTTPTSQGCLRVTAQGFLKVLDRSPKKLQAEKYSNQCMRISLALTGTLSYSALISKQILYRSMSHDTSELIDHILPQSSAWNADVWGM